MAQHPTEVIMDLELIQTEYAKEGVSMLQMVVKVMEETKKNSSQELLIREAWQGWEESLRTSPMMQRVREAALLDETTWEPLIHMRRLMREGQENMEKWVQFLGGPETFEEDGMEVNTFGLDEWDK